MGGALVANPLGQIIAQNVNHEGVMLTLYLFVMIQIIIKEVHV